MVWQTLLSWVGLAATPWIVLAPESSASFLVARPCWSSGLLGLLVPWPSGPLLFLLNETHPIGLTAQRIDQPLCVCEPLIAKSHFLASFEQAGGCPTPEWASNKEALQSVLIWFWDARTTYPQM